MPDSGVLLPAPGSAKSLCPVAGLDEVELFAAGLGFDLLYFHDRQRRAAV
jgi:hypothetical protein